MNCHGCRWLDETRPKGRGYCCMVQRSKYQKDKLRTEISVRCELFNEGDFKKRFDDLMEGV